MLKKQDIRIVLHKKCKKESKLPGICWKTARRRSSKKDPRGTTVMCCTAHHGGPLENMQKMNKTDISPIFQIQTTTAKIVPETELVAVQTTSGLLRKGASYATCDFEVQER